MDVPSVKHYQTAHQRTRLLTTVERPPLATKAKSYLDNKTVFLAGSTGMVGSGVLRCLLTQFPKTKIRALYHEKSDSLFRNERVTYVRGNLMSAETIRQRVTGCEVAVMAAAQTAGSALTTAEPWRFVNENLIMNAQVLEALYRENIKRVIMIGSASLYQDTDLPLKESDLDLNRDPHPAHFGIGWVMRSVEKLCQFWHEQYGLSVLTVRASNVFGPFAKFDPHRANFIPALIRKAVAHDDPFEVWGSPDVARDVIFVEDFARAIAMLLEADHIVHDTFNVGSGRPTRVGDVVTWALRYADHRPGQIHYNQNKPTTVKTRVLDCSKIEKAVGWKPQVSTEEGIRQTTEWWIQNKETWTK